MAHLLLKLSTGDQVRMAIGTDQDPRAALRAFIERGPAYTWLEVDGDDDAYVRSDAVVAVALTDQDAAVGHLFDVG